MGSKEAVIFTQTRYFTDPVINRIPITALKEGANDVVRNLSFGMIPHLGAKMLAGYL